MINKSLLTLNARGVKYEVLLKNIGNRHSSSRIGRLKFGLKNHQNINDLCDGFNLDTLEFYFDRDPTVLNSILNYVSYGELHLNDNMCVDLFAKELEYWGIDIDELAECCVSKYWKKKSELDDDRIREKLTIKEYLKEEDFGKYWPKFRKKIWKIITYAEKSMAAKVKFYFIF